MPETMISSASLSDCGRYRFSLTREWDSAKPRVLFIMLNPSTADAETDDPTIRRCIDFAQKWGHGSLEVVNLFAWRATNPAELRVVADPVGFQNESAWLRARERCSRVVAAWGATKGGWVQQRKVIEVFGDLDCIQFTPKGRDPQHPLYIKGDAQPIPFIRDSFLVPKEGSTV